MRACEVCVVHLVRAQNGIEPLLQFMSSYHRHDAGIKHQLLFALKGFRGDRIDTEYKKLLNSSDARYFFLGDWGYDITTYFRVVRATTTSRFFCFVNSFSEILADDWLLKLYQPSVSRCAGIVGATGSYQGFHRDWRSIQDREKFSLRSGWRQRLLKLPWFEDLNELTNRLFSPEFPNPHIRTNGFLIEREVMLALHPKMTLTKRHSYSFESGRQSMTRQVLKMNRSVHIVGRDGTIYDIDDWKRSNTFWQAEQQNLLISDKQTKRYQAVDDQTRKVFSRYAWGEDGSNALTHNRQNGEWNG